MYSPEHDAKIGRFSCARKQNEDLSSFITVFLTYVKRLRNIGSRQLPLMPLLAYHHACYGIIAREFVFKHIILMTEGELPRKQRHMLMPRYMTATNVQADAWTVDMPTHWIPYWIPMTSTSDSNGFLVGSHWLPNYE